MLVIIMVIIVILNSINQLQDEKRQEQELRIKEQEKIEKENAEINRSIEIYKKCQENGYDSSDSEKNEILSKSLNLSPLELKKLYLKGEKTVKLQEKQLFLSYRKQEQDFFDGEKAKTAIYGKSKYLEFLNKKLNAFKAVSAISELSEKIALNNAYSATHPSKSDPYVWAGMANGIAGPVAALATANDIQRENEESRLRGEISAQKSLRDVADCSARKSRSDKLVEIIQNMMLKVTDALIILDTNKLKNKINYDKITYSVTSTKNIEVNVKYTLSDIKVLKKDGILDGSLKVTVFDNDNKIIAEGYYNCKNIEMDESQNRTVINPENIGFKDKGQFNVLCVVNNYKTVRDKKDISRVEIEPINLWIIEKFY